MENILDAKIEVSILKGFLNAIKPINNECRIYVTPSGLKGRVINLPNTTLVSTTISIGSFEEYKNKEGTFCIDVREASKVLNAFSDDEVVRITHTPKSLLVTSDACVCIIELLRDIEVVRSPKEPELSIPHEVIVSGEILFNCVNKISKIADKIVFGVDASSNFFIGSMGSANEIRYKVECEKVSVDTCRSIFAIEYIRAIAKATRNENSIEVKLGIDYPVTFTTDDTMFMVAPRIESE